MVLLFGVWVGFTAAAEHQNNPAVAAAGVHSTVGNMEGKEVRFGDTTSALFDVSSTQTSDGVGRLGVRLLHTRSAAWGCSPA